jgi:hypothetical protein
MRRRASVTVMLAWLAGCGASREYTCPEPIGLIVRDDCQVYRTRYESLKVELAASVGPFGGKVVAGQQQLRDPSELLQVFGQRLHALCRDFNACRVPSGEYRARREAADRVLTTVSVVQEQLKGDLDPQSRAKLVETLVQALAEDHAPPRPARAGSAPVAATGSGYYSGWLPWYGAKLLPPQPATPSGFPRLTWVSVRIETSWRKVDEHTRRPDGYRPTVELALDGRVEADDTVAVDWGGRRDEASALSRSRNGLVIHHAAAPEDIGLKGASFTASVTYRRGSDGKTALIGRRTYPVLSSQEQEYGSTSIHYGLDHDPDAQQGCVVFRPIGDALPPDFDRPHLFVVLKFRKYQEATARCWVDGRPVGEALSSSRATGQEATFQDRPRHRQISPGRSEGIAHPFIEWWHYDFALPFAVPRTARPLPEKLGRWPLAGKWRCVVSVDGEPARELLFQVKADGSLTAHPKQTEHARPEWLVETRVVRNPTELAMGPTAPAAPAVVQPEAPHFQLATRLGAWRGSLSPAQLQQGLRAAQDKLRACLEQEGGPGDYHLKVHVFPTGEAGLHMGKPTDGWTSYCLSGALKAAKFPRAGDYTYFDVVISARGSSREVRSGPLCASNVRGGLRATEVLATITAKLAPLRRCASKTPTTYRLKLSVGTDGKPNVEDWAMGYHPAVVGCLGAELKQLRFRAAEPYTSLILQLRLP